jgi:hypothetical protein
MSDYIISSCSDCASIVGTCSVVLNKVKLWDIIALIGAELLRALVRLCWGHLIGWKREGCLGIVAWRYKSNVTLVLHTLHYLGMWRYIALGAAHLRLNWVLAISIALLQDTTLRLYFRHSSTSTNYTLLPNASINLYIGAPGPLEPKEVRERCLRGLLGVEDPVGFLCHLVEALVGVVFWDRMLKHMILGFFSELILELI